MCYERPYLEAPTGPPPGWGPPPDFQPEPEPAKSPRVIIIPIEDDDDEQMDTWILRISSS